MREGLSRPLWLALVIAAFCIPLFFGLTRTDVESDEAIYSFAVDEMLANGDWLTPRSSPRADASFLEKPPLKFWIVAAPIRLGLLPHDEFGLRFWDALFGAVSFLYVFAIGRRLAGPVCGVVAVMVLFGHNALLFIHGIRGNNMEAPLFLCYCGGLYHFIAWGLEERHGRRRAHVLATALYFYFGFMTKFVASFFLPVVVLASALAVPQTRERLVRDWRSWLGASLLVLVLAAPWFVYESIREGWAFWQVILGTHVLERFTTGLDPAHLHPWHYYYVLIWSDLRHMGVAWLFVAGTALAVLDLARTRRLEMVTVLAWLVLPLALMSIGRSKLPHYAFPFLPPFALLIGFGPGWLVRAGHGYLDSVMVSLDRWLTAGRWSAVVRPVCLVLALAAAVVAAVTLVTGGVNWKIGSVQILRNTHVFRPLILALLFAMLAGWGAVASRVVFPAVVLLAVLPFNAYEDALAQLRVERHPLRSTGDCMAQVRERELEAGRPAPGVYSIREQQGWFLHNYFYYLRRAGGWESVDHLDPAALDAALFEPGRQRPVMLLDEDYRAFKRSHGTLAEIPSLRLREALLLLPGPYASCGPEALARSGPYR